MTNSLNGMYLQYNFLETFSFAFSFVGARFVFRDFSAYFYLSWGVFECVSVFMFVPC